MKKYILASFITILSLGFLTSFTQAEEYTFSRDLSAGVSGDDVTALQSWLISSGYDIPAISSNAALKGYFGSQTRQALMKYQKSIGLPNTGYFGPLTRGRIHDEYRGNSLTVTSPNGREIWKKETIQNITWNSTFKPGLTEKFNQTVDIRLAFPLPACAKPDQVVKCMVKMRAPYTIAKGVSLSSGSYSWNVGRYISDIASLPVCVSIDTNGNCLGPVTLVEDGTYTIQVCLTNSSQCDESNNEFTITSGDVSSKVPVINGIDAPTTLNIGQTGTWIVRAMDPQNGSLAYSVDWGDIQDIYANLPSGSAAEPFPFVQNATFTHSYAMSGSYTIKFKVKNNAGLVAQSSITVKITSPSVGGPLRVTSPNGDETWIKRTQQNITWTAPAYFRATYADIRLARKFECTSQICPMIAYAPYTIASNININQGSYSWRVGEYYDASDNNPNAGIKASIPDSRYTIQICETGTTNCDSSDGFFTIISSTSAVY